MAVPFRAAMSNGHGETLRQTIGDLDIIVTLTGAPAIGVTVQNL